MELLPIGVINCEIKMEKGREGGRRREDEGIGQTEDEFELGEGGKESCVTFCFTKEPLLCLSAEFSVVN